MVWIVIAIVLIAAFGPIFWVMPSKRDRQLAKIPLVTQSRLSVMPIPKEAFDHIVKLGARAR